MRPKLTTVKPMQTAIVKPTLRSSATRKVASAKDASTARQLFRTERSRKDAEALTLAALADSLYPECASGVVFRYSHEAVLQ